MSRGSSELLNLVRAQVADAILAHADPDIQPDLIRLLARPGYALHPEGRCRAGLFALEVYAAVRRRYDRIALAAAAAVELQMQSGYVFDDVADGSPEPPGMDDQSPGDAGGGPSKAEELALAIALLTAGTAVAADAVTGAPDPGDALRHFCTATGGACAGQFLDARLHRRGDATLEEAHHMTRLKSGSLGAFAAGFAARLAGADTEGVAPLERLGFDLFTFAQLVDDQRDARPSDAHSDLARGKATLPVVFFGTRGTTERAIARGGTMTRRTLDAYEASGASVYTAVLALAYLGRARAGLQLLAGRGYAIDALDRFLGIVESDAAGALVTAGRGVGS